MCRSPVILVETKSTVEDVVRQLLQNVLTALKASCLELIMKLVGPGRKFWAGASYR